jgi:hypothetical protein
MQPIRLEGDINRLCEDARQIYASVLNNPDRDEVLWLCFLKDDSCPTERLYYDIVQRVGPKNRIDIPVPAGITDGQIGFLVRCFVRDGYKFHEHLFGVRDTRQ